VGEGERVGAGGGMEGGVEVGRKVGVRRGRGGSVGKGGERVVEDRRERGGRWRGEEERNGWKEEEWGGAREKSGERGQEWERGGGAAILGLVGGDRERGQEGSFPGDPTYLGIPRDPHGICT